jgi:hypothetical protein
MYMLDLDLLTQLAEEESKAFENALRILRERLNEYAVKYGLGDLLNVEEGKARGLAKAEYKELSEFSGVNFGTKALAALIAYREHVLGRRSLYGVAAWYWLEVGGSARLLYYAPRTAYKEAEKAGVERPVAVEEMVAEALRRLFLKPGADHYRGFVELLGSGKLALMLEKETESSYVFKLFRLEVGGLRELGVKLRISKVGEGEGITYTLFFDVERWLGFFVQRLEAAMKAAEEVEGRLPVVDRLPYKAGWVASDVAITRNKKGKRVLRMTTSHLWQLAETHALFGWFVVGLRMTLTLEGPRLVVDVDAPLGKLDEAIRRSTQSGWERSAEVGWLKMLGVEAESWDGLKRWVADHWSEVIDAVKKWLKDVKTGPRLDLANALRELEGLKSKLDDDKTAREVIAPALLLMQAERLGVNETTLRYFAAVASGAIDGDGYVSTAMKKIGLASGEHAVALLWAAALAAHGIKAEVRRVRGAFQVIVSSSDAVKLAGLYFLYGSPLLEGDERIINYKLAEAVKLGAEGLSVSWEGLRPTKSGGAADLTISEGDTAVKYNVYLRDKVELYFESKDRSRAELAARLLRLAGVSAEVKRKGDEDIWRVRAATDMLAAGRKELRDALTEIVKKAVENSLVKADKAERWLEKLESGRMLKEGWPKYEVGLVGGALVVRFSSTNSGNIEQEAQRFREMGLVEGVHFSVKMPEGGREGYVSILKEGLAYAARLSVYGKDEQQRSLAAAFVEYILQRAGDEGKDVYRKALEVVEEGRARGSLKLEGLEKKVEVNGKTYVVKVKGGEAVEEDRNGRELLRLKITAEVGRVEGEHTIVDRVVREYTITFGRYGKLNAAKGFAVARADAPGGRKADAERFSALIKALTGKEPWIHRLKNGKIMIECGRKHLDGFARYAELADAIVEWLADTDR